MPRGVATAAAGLHAVGEETEAERAFRSRHHRGAPSRALRPRRDSDAPALLAKCRCGRDPSMEGVQPSCQRSAPGIRVELRARCRPSSVGVAVHAASPASTHGAPVAPAFSSGRAGARRASGAPGPSADGRPCSNSHRGGPTPPSRVRRVNGERELADEEHLSPAKSTRERALCANFCNRRETRAHPRGDRDPARAAVARGALAPPIGACGRRRRPEPSSPAVTGPGARAWLHGGPERIRERAPSS